MTEHTPVLIVGAGPVGLALAADLGWRGIDCVLIEKTGGEIVAPKMDMVGVRTMEFCRRWGIADWVENSPYPRDYPQDNVYVTTLTGYELGREVIPSKSADLPPWQSPHNRERCPQDMFDPILQRFVLQLPKVSLRYRTELQSLVENEEGVIATVFDHERNEAKPLRADYVVGTDGGSSTVRGMLGIDMLGRPVLTYTTNVIFRCANLSDLHDKGKAYRFIFIDEQGTWLTIVAINGADRWRMSIVGTAEKRVYDEVEIRAMIVRAMGHEFDFEVVSTMPWTRRELVAARYGTKRIFIAGDAAHLMSPTGGFGMNTGIGDAIDLGWKLEAVTRGWGGEALLASYEIERKPIAIRAINESSGNLQRMLATRERRPPPTLFEPGAENDKLRREFGAWYAETMRREWFTLGIHLGYSYFGSPVIWSDGSPRPAEEIATYRPTTTPGSRAPHLWLADGRSTLDLFGRGYVLMRLGKDAPAGRTLQTAAEKVGLPFSIVENDDPAVFDAYERQLVLVRPDGQVAWRSNEEPFNAPAIIDVVRGAAQAQRLAQAV